MTRAIFDTLLDEARATHDANVALTAFCPFPDDVTPQPVTPHHIPASDLLQVESALNSTTHAALRDAVIAAAPHAHWRETYKGTDIGEDFLNRFGCYGLIGAGGPFTSAHMWAWAVYMPPNLHYPWHHHPGEESYLVLAGEAEFHAQGQPSETLCEGGLSIHGPDQPHAMTTHDHPVLAYVTWRNGFDTAPRLTAREVRGK